MVVPGTKVSGQSSKRKDGRPHDLRVPLASRGGSLAGFPLTPSQKKRMNEMAEALSANVESLSTPEPPAAGHNRKDFSEAIARLASSIAPIEAQISALNAERKAYRQNFKAETGIALADFDAARSRVSIENDDDRKQKIANFQACFNALSPGEQLNWLDAE